VCANAAALMYARAYLGLVVALLLAGCASGPRDKRMQIGMLVRGLGDRSFSDSADAGLREAQRRFDFKVALLQTHAVSDYQPDLMALANGGSAETFAIGYAMSTDLADVAPRFPKSHFAIIDAVVDAPNVTSVTFKAQEGSFLAGALAALTSKTKTIAFLGGIDDPVIRTFEAGYLAGARQADPAVHVLVKFVGSFEDVAAGKELAGLLYSEHADIIYAAAGSAGLGAIDEARNRPGDYVIGVDMDEDGIAPGQVLTSVLKRVDVGVYRVCALAAAHQPRPRHLSFGLREGGVGLTDFRYTRALISAQTIARVDALKAALIRGTIVAPVDLEGVARYQRATP
jgi:basic membrane protein A